MDPVPAKATQAASQGIDKIIQGAMIQALGPKSAHGQEIIRFLAERYYLYESPHVPGDPQETAFRAGQQKVVQDMIKLIGLNGGELVANYLELVRDQRRSK